MNSILLQLSNFESAIAVFTIRAMTRAFDNVVTQRDTDRLAQLLRQARIETGLAQQDLADRLGVPVSVLSKMETGHRSVQVLEMWAICKALGLNFSALGARMEELLSETA